MYENRECPLLQATCISLHKSGVNTFDPVAFNYKLHQLTRQNICSKLRNSLGNKTMHMQKHCHVLLSEKNVRIFFEFVLEGNIHKNLFL